MSSPTRTKPTILVLGATGGCVLAFLVRALNAGYNCSALVRTPAKLTKLLESRNVAPDVISHHLSIVQGNAKDSTKLAEALVVNDRVVDVIVSGVGGVPQFTPNPLRPTLDDPTVCQDTTRALLDAVRSKAPSKKPIVVVISTTGMSDHGRDIPVSMVPLYHWMLPVPHKDKKEMERLLAEEAKTVPSCIEGFVVVRASLLTNGPALGAEKIRVGVESLERRESPAIGYTISRADVGGWIFEALLEDRDGGRDTYLNKFVTVTY